MRARHFRWFGLTACLASLLAVAGCQGAPSHSVLLIVVDTLRADHLGVYGYDRPTSPHLDAWAEGGAVFEQAFATSPWTLPSVGTIFTGQLPSRHLAGTFARGPDGRPPDRSQFGQLDASLPTLAEAAAARGFATGAVINNAFLGPRFGLDRGFETYDFSPAGNRRLRRADVVVDRALSWLGDRVDAPFFLVLHLFDPHMQYDPPAATRGRFSSALPDTELPRVTERIRAALGRGDVFDRDYLVALYDEEVLFVDQQLGRLFEWLASTDRANDMVVMLTSDHGEELFDHGGFEHGHTAYNELLRVPLVVRGPGVEAGRHAVPVSGLDLFPTLLEALGHAAADDLPGRSLWPALAGGGLIDRPLFAERTLYGAERQAVVSWPYKMTRRSDTDEVQLFDLSADAGERHDLASARPEDVERLHDVLQTALAAASGGTAAEVDLDDETLEALRSLGYVR
ncbi:MAG: hypothetical protein CL471_06860 [Acidobacteria bacterium]|nr:hypothetical protein [Acidobacteriota bacterium]